MKKIYMKPDMMVVELRSHQPLLAGSDPEGSKVYKDKIASEEYESI